MLNTEVNIIKSGLKRNETAATGDTGRKKRIKTESLLLARGAFHRVISECHSHQLVVIII